MADPKLTAEEINELKKLIRELDYEISQVEFDNLLKSGAGAKALLKNLRNEASDLNRELSSLAGHIGDMAKELRKSESTSAQITKSFREIDDIGRQILNHQKGYNELSSDDADNLVLKLKYEKQRLESLQKQYSEEQKIL